MLSERLENYALEGFFFSGHVIRGGVQRRERCGSRFSNHSGGTQTPVTPTPLTPLSALSSPAPISACSSISLPTNDSERIYLNTNAGCTGVALKLAPPPLPKKRTAVMGNNANVEPHKACLDDMPSAQ
ncbi:unnamed protein product [Toxocara canis]|uniref:Uncharacterized protein n=1 Tax=Toxocara canis TaxID=6265 RepID=A0A183TZX7_TOXCA|nr:unnamed protein product [Toxocara canis]